MTLPTNWTRPELPQRRNREKAPSPEVRDPRAANPDLLVYYFPQWHPEPKNDKLWHKGWTEWETVRNARPRFEGHQQPKRPLWGETDESDPAVASQIVGTALDHAISGFIVDWYWFDNAAFLNGALDRGLLKADRIDEFNFALMWANHDWTDLYPAAHPNPARLLPAPNTRYHARNAFRHVIERYLTHPSYYTLRGSKYFSIYDIMSFVEGLGGVSETAAMLDWFRQEARSGGVGELHLNVVITPQIPDPDGLVAALGFDSATHYTWWHHSPNGFDQFPVTPYERAFAYAQQTWASLRSLPVPYLPNVTMGWDPSPRTVPWDMTREIGYPFTSIMNDNTPENLRRATEAALQEAADQNSPAVVVNAWNEWTEGSYLEPDEDDGYRFLEAIRSARQAVAAHVEATSSQKGPTD